MPLKPFGLRRLPHPSLSYANVVSSLALFLAIGGVSWAAATLPKNSVGAKQLKKNAVTTKKIKKYAVTNSKIRKNAVTSSRIKNGSVLSDDINLATLGKVPSAANSDTVSTTVGPVSKRVAASGSGATTDAGRAAAAEVPLVTVGQISLYGKCFVETTSNTLWAEIIMRTSQDGALAMSTNNNHTGATFLDTTTAENMRIADDGSAANNTGDYGSDTLGSVIGPDGNGLMYQTVTWVKHGAIAGSSPLATATDLCYFHIAGDRLLPPT